MKENRLVFLGPGLRKGWRCRFNQAGYDVIDVTPKVDISFSRVIQLARPSYEHLTFIGREPLTEHSFDAGIYVSGLYDNNLILASWKQEEILRVPSTSMERIFLEVWAWLTEQFFPDDLTIP